MTITTWPSKAGATITHHGMVFDLWNHGGVTKLAKDNSPTGYYGVAYMGVDTAGSLTDIALRAIIAWQTRRNTWLPCE